MAIIQVAFSAAEGIETLNTYDAQGAIEDEDSCWIAASAVLASDFAAEDPLAFVSFLTGAICLIFRSKG